jgi:hypothetical protein
MISSWKELVYTLEQMRRLQKNPGTRKSLELRFRLSRAEADVDACIEAKTSEWAAERQPELISNGGQKHGKTETERKKD